MDTSKLGGIADISRITGILPPNVVKLAKRKGFPVPIIELPHKRLWNLEEVIEWIDKNSRKRPLRKLDAQYDKYVEQTKKDIAVGDIAIPENLVIARGEKESIIADTDTGEVKLVSHQTEFEILRGAHYDSYKKAGLNLVAEDILKTRNIIELRLLLARFQNLEGGKE